MWLLKYLFFALFLFADCKKFRYDYTYNSEIDGWMKLHRRPAEWREARLRCKLEGAILASPNDDQMFRGLTKFIKDHVSANKGVFTGTHATFSKGDFFSVEGVALDRMPVEWLPEEPNNLKNNENCIMLMGNGSAADVSCTSLYPYICYKKRTEDLVMNGCGTTDREYNLEPRTGSCYKFHRVARTWSRAFMTCASEGGHLAIPNSQQEAVVFKEIFGKSPQSSILQVNNNLMKDIMHIGFHDWDERADWTTIHGIPITESGFNIWPKGQPDNATTGEFCGSMWRGGDLNDVWCGEIGPFLCEMTPDSLQKENPGVDILNYFRIRDDQ